MHGHHCIELILASGGSRICTTGKPLHRLHRRGIDSRTLVEIRGSNAENSSPQADVQSTQSLAAPALSHVVREHTTFSGRRYDWTTELIVYEYYVIIPNNFKFLFPGLEICSEAPHTHAYINIVHRPLPT